MNTKALFAPAVITAALLIRLAPNERAGIIVTTGAGSAVSSPSGLANFNTLVTGSPLSSYTEDGLSVSIPASDFTIFDPTAGNGDPDGAFLLSGSPAGFFYANGGVSPVFIHLSGGGNMSGVEFDVGNGFGTTQTFLAYITNDGSGVATVLSGRIVGFSDQAGFHSLMWGHTGALRQRKVHSPTT